MKLIASLATAGLLVSPVAFAQTATPPASPPAQVQQTASASSGKVNLRQRMTQDLQKAGFTDVSVVPDSFLVQAKDRDGNPVTMFVTPTSMTALVAQTQTSSVTAPAANTDPSHANAGTDHQPAPPRRTTKPMGRRRM